MVGIYGHKLLISSIKRRLKLVYYCLMISIISKLSMEHIQLASDYTQPLSLGTAVDAELKLEY